MVHPKTTILYFSRSKSSDFESSTELLDSKYELLGPSK